MSEYESMTADRRLQAFSDLDEEMQVFLLDSSENEASDVFDQVIYDLESGSFDDWLDVLADAVTERMKSLEGPNDDDPYTEPSKARRTSARGGGKSSPFVVGGTYQFNTSNSGAWDNAVVEVMALGKANNLKVKLLRRGRQYGRGGGRVGNVYNLPAKLVQHLSEYVAHICPGWMLWDDDTATLTGPHGCNEEVNTRNKDDRCASCKTVTESALAEKATWEKRRQNERDLEDKLAARVAARKNGAPAAKPSAKRTAAAPASKTPVPLARGGRRRMMRGGE